MRYEVDDEGNTNIRQFGPEKLIDGILLRNLDHESCYSSLQPSRRAEGLETPYLNYTMSPMQVSRVEVLTNYRFWKKGYGEYKSI